MLSKSLIKFENIYLGWGIRQNATFTIVTTGTENMKHCLASVTNTCNRRKGGRIFFFSQIENAWNWQGAKILLLSLVLYRRGSDPALWEPTCLELNAWCAQKHFRMLSFTADKYDNLAQPRRWAPCYPSRQAYTADIKAWLAGYTVFLSVCL